MKNRTVDITESEGGQERTRLPEKALDLMDSILRSWTQLDQLVQAEWKAVLRGEFSTMYRFSRGKEILCDHITGYEEDLAFVLEGILPQKTDPSRNLISLLLGHLEFGQGKRLMDFHTRRANLKIKVAITNRRTMTWVRERMDLSNELLEILTGNKLRKSATYLPPGKSIVYRRARDPRGLTLGPRNRDKMSMNDKERSGAGASRHPGMQVER